MTTDPLEFSSEEERAVQTGDGDRDQFNRQEHAAHDGVRGRRSEDEMDAEKLGLLSRRGFPGRKQYREYQSGYHAVEQSDVELLCCRDVGPRGRGWTLTPIEPVTTVCAEAIDLGQRSLAGRTGLHSVNIMMISPDTQTPVLNLFGQ